MAERPKPKVKSFKLDTGTNAQTQSVVLGMLVLGSLAAFWLFGGLNWFSGRQLDSIQIQVAEDMEAQYRLMGSESTEIDKCVQAGVVAAAWLQAQDQVEYQNWKLIENGHCEAAGLPQ
ncbi:MAG: hypothetical protein AAF959_15185 [Cyanobacteria bacterium P01_D01_bin.56]